MQEINLSGICISAPKTYETPNDGPCTQFYVMCGRIRRRGERKTDYFSIKSFGKRGEMVQKFIHNGMKVWVKGELQAETIERPTGKVDVLLNVRASCIEFFGKRDEIDEAILTISDDQDEYIDIAEDLVGW